MNNYTFGDEDVGYYETIAGGAGAVSISNLCICSCFVLSMVIFIFRGVWMFLLLVTTRWVIVKPYLEEVELWVLNLAFPLLRTYMHTAKILWQAMLYPIQVLHRFRTCTVGGGVGIWILMLYTCTTRDTEKRGCFLSSNSQIMNKSPALPVFKKEIPS